MKTIVLKLAGIALLPVLIMLASCTQSTPHDTVDSPTAESPMGTPSATESYATPNIVSPLIVSPSTPSDEMIIAEGETEVDGSVYTVQMIQTEYAELPQPGDEGYSRWESRARGRFNIVVLDARGDEVSRLPHEDIWGDRIVVFSGKIDLLFSDIIGEGCCFNIGCHLPETDSPYMCFAIINIDGGGTLKMLPCYGFGSAGYANILSRQHSEAFTPLEGGEKGFNVTVLDNEHDSNTYMSAKYVWDGEKFVFESNGSLRMVIAEGETEVDGSAYTAQMIQVEYAEPLTPDDEGFTLWESGYRGRFDVVILDAEGSEVSRLPHEDIWGDRIVAFGGGFELLFSDIIGEGICFNIGCHLPETDNAYMCFAIFNIDSNGNLKRLYCGGFGSEGYANARAGHAEAFTPLGGAEKGFEVTVFGGENDSYAFISAKYVWDGEKFMFTRE